MKNYKVEAIMKFTDKEENTKRNVGDQFNTTKERYDYLKSHNAVKLVEIEEVVIDEIVEDVVDDIIESEEVDEIIDNVVDEVVEEIIDKKKKKNRK